MERVTKEKKKYSDGKPKEENYPPAIKHKAIHGGHISELEMFNLCWKSFQYPHQLYSICYYNNWRP